MTEQASTSSDPIQEWVEERISNPQLAEQVIRDPTNPLLQLFAAAASERPSLAPDETERILAGVLASVESEHDSRLLPAPWWKLAAAVVVVGAALAALLMAPRRGSRLRTPGVLIKEVAFESVHNDKTVSFELRLYRTEASDAASPQP